MTDLDKLRVLLPHWIEHNHSHELEVAKWAELAAKGGDHKTAELLEKANGSMEAADRILAEALEHLGGPVAGHQHHHE